MFYCVVEFTIAEDSCANILIEADTREGCIEKMADFIRNTIAGENGQGWWSGGSGIMSCLFLAQQQGYTVYNVGPGGSTLPNNYFQEGGNVQVGFISRYCDRCLDTFDCTLYDGNQTCDIITESDIDYGGDCYHKEKDRPDFAACADKIIAEACPA